MRRQKSAVLDSQFSTEAELASPVEAWLEFSGSTCIGREVEVGFGIPDLVGGIGRRTSLSDRQRQGQPLTHALQLGVLEFCQTSRSEAELRQWAPNGFADFRRRTLTPLLNWGLLDIHDNHFRALVKPQDPFERIIAIELKLSDVKRGLSQAFAYRAFADASYLALPAHRMGPELMERARDIGVGLLAVHTTRVEEIVEPDTNSRATAGRRRMASEYTLAAHADANSRSAGAPRRS